MLRSSLAALALAGLVSVGCDNAENETGTPETVQDTAQKAGNEAANALDKVQDKAEDATENMQDRRENANVNPTTPEGIQQRIDTLIEQAKDAAENKKWDQAKNLVKQIEDLKSKLPANAQASIDRSLAEVRKLLETGQTAQPGGANAK